MLLDEMRRWIDEYDLLPEKSRVLVGVSGGPDSLALLHALRGLAPEFRWTLFVVHVDHGLRGEESRRDAAFVCETADKWGLPCDVERVDVSTALHESGGNKQDVARRLRYQAFARVAARRDANRLALAHQADDQVETVLMRILRGTSPAGLAGIPVSRSWNGIQLVRPLLGVSRAEVEAYCRERGLVPRLDESNREVRFTRNRIRLELLPLLEEYNPRFRESILQLNRLAAEEASVWERMEEEALQKVATREKEGPFVLNVRRFSDLDVALQRRVIKLILNCLVEKEANEVTLSAVEGVRHLAAGPDPSAFLHLPGGLRAEREYDRIRVFRTSPETTSSVSIPSVPTRLDIPGETVFPVGRIRTFIRSNLISSQHLSGHIAVFDLDRLNQTLTVRFRRPGDRMHPKGLGGTKKVKDILIDAKVPRRLRDTLPLILHSEEILWIPGVARSEKALVSKETRRFLYMAWEESGS
ncbi:tRNA lysidine(34) synthetase TilS [Salinithrix halophila]|uniref:tRNA(Ile)-lysidine synthase n=1 Tax=Salinithrix halophila TaxID=1485204 RepID=A0ABV8JFE0_9BACL